MCASPTSGIVSTLIRSPRVVAVRLAHGPEGHLGDLGAPADHDDPLAEDRIEGPGRVNRADVRELPESGDQCLLVDALDFQFDLVRGGSPSIWRIVASARIRPPSAATCAVTAEMASARSTMSNRIAAVSAAFRRGISRV
jgi:hypothetical protein